MKDETRVNATSDEAEEWRKQNEGSAGGYSQLNPWFSLLIRVKAPPPNFISDIFFLTLTQSHYGYLKTVSDFEDLGRQYDDMQRHLEMLEGDGAWRGVRDVTTWLMEYSLIFSDPISSAHGSRDQSSEGIVLLVIY